MKLFEKKADKTGHFGLFVIGILILLAGVVALVSIIGFYADITVFVDLMGLLNVFGFEMTLVGGVVGVIAAIFFLFFGFEIVREKKWAYWVYHIFVFVGFIFGVYSLWLGLAWVSGGAFSLTFLLLFYLRWIAKDVSKEACEEDKPAKILACSLVREKIGR